MVKNPAQETEHQSCPPQHTALPTDAKGEAKGNNSTTALESSRSGGARQAQGAATIHNSAGSMEDKERQLSQCYDCVGACRHREGKEKEYSASL